MFVGRLAHLVRRWWGSLSTRPLSTEESDWVAAHLSEGERDIFERLSVADRRHAVLVARRFLDLCPSASRDHVAAALLHDVGKTRSALSTGERVLATMVGPRTHRFREYHDHERIGWVLCREAGSSPATLDLLAGRADPLVVDALRRADNI
ncbi:MAG: hypothetical protein ACO3GZ_05360 [Ilumatobacteraceae bacterium]